MPILEFKNVSKVYDNVTKALEDINFTVEEGEFVSIIGPSGAGKSTLLRCINRMIDTSEGVVMLDGQDITHVKGKELRDDQMLQCDNLVCRFPGIPDDRINGIINGFMCTVCHMICSFLT